MSGGEVRVALIQQTGLGEKPERNLDELLEAIDRAASGGVDLMMPTELALTRDWLRSKGNSIEGGTSEIQLNIIGKRVLGLPD